MIFSFTYINIHIRTIFLFLVSYLKILELVCNYYEVYLLKKYLILIEQKCVLQLIVFTVVLFDQVTGQVLSFYCRNLSNKPRILQWNYIIGIPFIQTFPKTPYKPHALEITTDFSLYN